MVSTTQDYIESFPPEVQPILLEVVAAMRRGLPGAQEQIRYGMPALMIGDRYGLHFAGWKKHVGLYPVPVLEAELEGEVAPYRSGKDTVRFFYCDPIPVDLVEQVAAAIARSRAT